MHARWHSLSPRVVTHRAHWGTHRVRHLLEQSRLSNAATMTIVVRQSSGAISVASVDP